MEYIEIIKNELLNCMPHLKEEYLKEEELYDNFWKLMAVVKNTDIKAYNELTRTELLLLRYRSGIIDGTVRSYDEIAYFLHVSTDDVNKIRQNAFLKIERVMRNGFEKREFASKETSKALKDYYNIELMLRKQFLSDYACSMNEENVVKVR